MRYTFAFLLIGLFALSSCLKPVEAEVEEVSQPYFDVNALVAKQLSLLEGQGAKLKKVAVIDGKQEEGAPDDINWKKELRLFEQLDINKPVLLRSYSIDSLEENGMQRIDYKALDADLKVREMSVWLNAEAKAAKLSGMVQEENAVYLARRYMTLQLKEGKVESYRLEGFQKVTTQDTMKYELDAEVIW